MSLFYLVLYLSLSSFGLYKLKSSHTLISLDFGIGMAGYAVGFLVWLSMLRQFPLSFIFPVAAAGLILSTQLVGHFILAEPMHLPQLLGIIFIIFGIFLIYE